MPKKIDWSKNESNVRLLAATYAVLGKDTFSGCFADIARLFGGDATYDAINHRFRAIADKAEQLQEGLDVVLRPTITRKRRRRDHTPTLESDDYLVIEEGQNEAAVEVPRNAASQRRRDATLDPRLVPTVHTDVIEVALHSEMRNDGKNAQIHTIPQIQPTVAPSSVKVDMEAKSDGTLEARMARSSQEHAEQRAKSRRMYMDASSSKTTNGPPTLWQQQPRSEEPQPGALEGCGSINSTSYIDPIKSKCILCNLKWDDVEKAREHEALSALHRSKLQQPELVQTADRKRLAAAASRTRVDVVGSTAEVDHPPSRPAMNPSSPAVDDTTTTRTRESSVIIVEAPPRRSKGKRRAVLTATPRQRFSSEMRRFLVRGRKDLPKHRETFAVMEELARELDREFERDSSSSVWVESACDDSQDEDYMS